MEVPLSVVVSVLVPMVEACGALVIVVEVARTVVLYFVGLFRPGDVSPTRLRIRLGQSMVLGLEFQVAADILKTAISHEWNDLLQLAALIALRTLLNYLLERELDKLNRERTQESGDECEPSG